MKKFETINEEIVEGKVIDLSELNRLAKSGEELTYKGNYMPFEDGTREVYMFFIGKSINYLVEI